VLKATERRFEVPAFAHMGFGGKVEVEVEVEVKCRKRRSAHPLYTASEKVWALPNLSTRVYTRLEVVWSPSTKYCVAKPLRCRYSGGE